MTSYVKMDVDIMSLVKEISLHILRILHRHVFEYDFHQHSVELMDQEVHKVPR